MGNDFSKFLQIESADNRTDDYEEVNQSQMAIVHERSVVGVEKDAKLENLSKNKSSAAIQLEENVNVGKLFVTFPETPLCVFICDRDHHYNTAVVER